MRQRLNKSTSMGWAAGFMIVATGGCDGHGGPLVHSGDDGTSEVEVALTTVPSGVLCVRIDSTVGGQAQAARLLSVTPGMLSPSLSLGTMPAGAASFSGVAFNVACASVVASTPASWIADSATATLSPGIVTTVPMIFRRNNPVSVNANFLDNVSELAVGNATSYARMTDGTVKQWGQVGFASALQPAPVSSLTGVAQIAPGNGFACARKIDGTVWCWGIGSFGSLGPNAPTNFSLTPVQVPLIAPATDLSAGSAHVCARLNQSQIYCWGHNDQGQLGNGTTTDSATPVLSLIGGSQIFAGFDHSCVVIGFGEVWCWGGNAGGEIGDGTRVSRPTPFPLSLEDVVSMALGRDFSCALRGDGTVRCWGSNSFGALGDGTQIDHLMPAIVTGISDATQIVAGLHSACARRADATVTCWGFGPALGDGAGGLKPLPGAVPGLSGVAAIHLHLGDFACAELNDRTAKCWGENSSGQIGDGTSNVATKPTSVLLQ
jgi:hypothetical protein